MFYKSKLLKKLLFLSMALFFYACQEEVEDTPNPTPIDNDDLTPSNDTQTLACSVGEGETLTLTDLGDGVDYIAECIVDVRGDLIIESGVVIQFADDTGIRTRESSSVSAVGTAQNSIIFTGETKVAGAWRGIYHDSNDRRNQMSFCQIEYAGGRAFNSNNDLGGVILPSDTYLRMNDCTIKQSESYGINATYSLYDLEFENNTITECGEAAMYVEPNVVPLILGGSFTGNAIDAIRIDAAKTISNSQTWKGLGVPYRISSSIGSNLWINNSKLTIEPNITIEFENELGIVVKESDASTLVAVGTEESPIIFTGVTRVPEAWDGIEFSFTKSPENEISHAIIEYTGSEKGAIYFWSNSALRISNTTFKDISTCAFYDAPKADNNPSGQIINSNLQLDL